MKNRRALSTVVGGVFFMVVVMTAAAYMTHSMGLLDNFTQSVFVIGQNNEDRKNEEFLISSVNLVNNKFNITIQNTGNLPIKFSRLWVENTTSTDQVYKFNLDDNVAPGREKNNIGQNIPLTAFDTQTYNMKLITERGNTKEFLVNSVTEPIFLKLFAMPDRVSTGFTTTLLLAVTNNSTKNLILTNLQPTLEIASLGASAVLAGNNPSSYAVLKNGETTYFDWSYSISGDDEDKVRFTASLQNGVLGNSDTVDVEIETVSFAEQSASALESNLLSSTSTVPNDIIIFHEETTDALTGRQMWSRGPEDNTGEIIDLSTTDAVFYTNSFSNVTVSIPSGNWNATLRYVSSPMPDSLLHTGNTAEDMTYHFATDSDFPSDSTTNSVMTLGTGSNRPVWESTGHQGAGSYLFNGQNYATISTNNDNDVSDSPDTTAGWFKASSTGPSSKQVIFHGQTTAGTKYYEITLDLTGQLVFELNTGTTTTCSSGATYKDDTWHHFVAVRPTDNECKLYVDGQLKSSQNNFGSGSVNLQGLIYVGAKDGSGPGSNEGFYGSLDDLIHWNDYALIEVVEQEVTDLYNTNYGSSAHLMDIKIEIVDKLGNDLSNPQKDIVTTVSYPFKFMDSINEYSNPSDSIWGQFNFTAMTIPSKIIDETERLKINMTLISKTTGNLKMKLAIDDSGITSGLGNSFLQTPFPSTAYPGYYTYDNSNRGTISIFNSGTKGAWLNLLSRVVFEHETTNDPYASFIDVLSGKSISSTHDSVLFPAGQTVTLEFDRPRSQPGQSASSTLIPEGRYRMSIFLSGYDQTGKILLTTTYLGVVRVI